MKRFLHILLLLALVACSRIPEAYTLLPGGAQAYAKLRVDALQDRSGDRTFGNWLRSAGLDRGGEVLLALAGQEVTAIVPVSDTARFAGTVRAFAEAYRFPVPAPQWQGRLAVLRFGGLSGPSLSDTPGLRDFIASDEDFVFWTPSDGSFLDVRFAGGKSCFWLRSGQGDPLDGMGALFEQTGRFSARMDFRRPEVVSFLADRTEPVYTEADYAALDRMEFRFCPIRRELGGAVYLADAGRESLSALIAPVEGKLMLLKMFNTPNP